MLLDTPDGVVAWDRVSGDDRRRIIVNFTGADVATDLGDGWVVEVATGANDFAGVLRPDEAMVLVPNP